MKLYIQIDVDNDAFNDAGEIGRILLQVAGDVEETDHRREYPAMTIHDVNGNTVGSWSIRKS